MPGNLSTRLRTALPKGWKNPVRIDQVRLTYCVTNRSVLAVGVTDRPFAVVSQPNVSLLDIKLSHDRPLIYRWKYYLL
jgi:hypothetical protein